MTYKLFFLFLFLYYHLIPGIFFLLFLNINKLKQNFFYKISLIIPISITLITLLATLLTVLKIPFNSLAVNIFIGFLLILNILKFKKTIFINILYFLKTSLKNYFILIFLIIFGCITAGTIYFAIRNQIVPPSNDILVHQKIVKSIVNNKNVTLETVNPFYNNDYRLELYPFALHTITALTYNYQPNNYRSVYIEILLLTISLPLSIYIFSFFLFKDKIIALLSSLISISFGYFPYWAYGWGGYPLILSLTILPICFLSILDLITTKSKRIWERIIIAASLSTAMYYTHLSELLYSIPIFFLTFFIIYYKYINLQTIKRIFLLIISFLILISYSIPSLLKSFLFYSHVASDPKYSPFIKSRYSFFEYYDKIYHIIFNNNSQILSYIFIFSFVALLINFKKKSNRFITLLTIIFSIILIDSDTNKLLYNIFSITPWASWERIGYHFIYFISPIIAYGLIILFKKIKIPVYFSFLIIFLFIFHPIKNNYERMLSVANETIFSSSEKQTIDWMNQNLNSNNVILNNNNISDTHPAWWIPIMTNQSLVFPYTSHLMPDFTEKNNFVSDSILNINNNLEFVRMMKKINANLAIANKNDRLDGLPFVAYFNQSPCLKLLYPIINNINCQNKFDTKNNKIISIPDPQASYLYSLDESCNNTQINICQKNKKNFINISDLPVNGNKYGIENNDGYFYWFKNYAIIPIPSNIKKNISIEIRRPTTEKVTFIVFDNNQNFIDKISLDKDNWNTFIIKIKPDTKFITIFTDYQYKPINDERNLSFSIRNIYF